MSDGPYFLKDGEIVDDNGHRHTLSMPFIVRMLNENHRLRQTAGGVSVDVERVKKWFYSKPRKRAETAFTAGNERQLAYMLEDAESGVLKLREDLAKI